MRHPGRAARGGAGRAQRRAGGVRRGRGGEDGAAAVCGGVGGGYERGPGGRGGVGDGARIRRAAPAVRAAARSPRAPAGSAARRARDCLRPDRGGRSRPFPGRPGGAEPVVGGGRGTAAGLGGRRRAVARPGVGPGAGVRRAAASRRVRAASVRHAGGGRGFPRAARADPGRLARRGRAGTAGAGGAVAAGRAGTGPDRGRDRGEPAGAARAAAGVVTGRTGRRFRRPGCATAVRTDRGQLPAADERPARAGPALAAGRGRGADWRSGPGVEGRGAARPRHRRGR